MQGSHFEMLRSSYNQLARDDCIEMRLKPDQSERAHLYNKPERLC